MAQFSELDLRISESEILAIMKGPHPANDKDCR
jgi:uncharacterized protein YehS (DUF1456 family)